MRAIGARRSPNTSSLGFFVALLLGLGAMILVAQPVSGLTVEQESYPPDAIVNLIDPLGCDPDSAAGIVETVQPGSAVSIQVILVNEVAGIIRQAAPTGDVLGSTTQTADAGGRVTYTMSIETGRYGSAIVYATGTDSVGDPFALQTPAEIVECPDGRIPTTGSNSMRWLQLGLIILATGVILAAAARRRHVRTTS